MPALPLATYRSISLPAAARLRYPSPMRALAFSLALFLTAHLAADEPVYHPGTTRKVLQLTGDVDAPLRRPTLSRSGLSAGVFGTDLGHSFEHRGRLCFLFGDTVGRGGFLDDCLAFSDSTDPRRLTLDFPVGNDGLFVPLRVPGIRHGAMEVPTGGISLSGRMYVSFTTGFVPVPPIIGKSVLAKSDDDGRTWKLLYDLSVAQNNDMKTLRFLVVDMLEVDAVDYPGRLPVASGKVVLIWGSGEYRKSHLYLAAIPSERIEDKSAMRYYSGFREGAPVWSENERDAIALFADPQVGEFSVDWIAPVERWIVLYNSVKPAGVLMRSATAPWGPWSAPRHIVDPIADGGMARWMHVPDSLGPWDGFSDPGKEAVPGGLYGPYLINRFTRGDAERCTLYYTLSTWNPYQVVLMQSEIGRPLPMRPGREKRATLAPGDKSWKRSAPECAQWLDAEDGRRLTTFTDEGDAATGYLWRRLPCDDRNLRLAFNVSGGQAEVLLLEGAADLPDRADPAQLYRDLKAGRYGDVVQCAWGRNHDAVRVPVDWDLRPIDSANLTLVIIDHLATRWGRVSVSEMTLSRR
ncbi:DUF4185 domain-containing protein [bacterium]|nr:DUF4185 domain-containing protein [bacterium]